MFYRKIDCYVTIFCDLSGSNEGNTFDGLCCFASKAHQKCYLHLNHAENFNDLIDVPHSSQYELGPFLSALQRMSNYAAWNEKKSFDNQFLKLTVLVQEHLLEPDLKNA